MLRHLLGFFLTHRATQQVRATERIATDDLRHLHHLLLVNHDAVGLGENAFDAWIRIVDALPAMFAFAKIGNEIHRTRAIERYQRDDVFEMIGLGLEQHIAHAATFQLEHGRGIRRFQDVVARFIVQRNAIQIELGIERRTAILAVQILHGTIKNRQRRQAKKVEFHQADRFDIVLVELADDALATLAGIERTKIRELAGCDQNATGMHANIAR